MIVGRLCLERKDICMGIISVMFKKRRNLCILPFVHLASQANGSVQLCCRVLKILNEQSSGRPLSFGVDSLDRIWNGPEMRKVCLDMLQGKKLPECQNCWSEENQGRQSKRIRENKKFEHLRKTLLKRRNTIMALCLCLPLP